VTGFNFEWIKQCFLDIYLSEQTIGISILYCVDFLPIIFSPSNRIKLCRFTSIDSGIKIRAATVVVNLLTDEFSVFKFANGDLGAGTKILFLVPHW
jgi:hypothetical protein